MQQVVGLSQIAGELMMVDPAVIDLGWGNIKSGIANLKTVDFADSQALQRSIQRVACVVHKHIARKY